MPRNGSGTYSLYTPGNPVVTGTTISSTWANNSLNDIATALTNSIAKDGQTTPTANLPMGTFKLTGLGSGNAKTDSLNLGQAQDEAYQSLSSVAGTNTITASTAPATTAYASGQTYKFVAAASNTGAVTININGLGAKSITKNGTTAMVTGDILINGLYVIVYDGTQFQLLNSSLGFQGGTVANATTFSSTVTITGNADLNGNSNSIKGTITNDNASSGDIGEYIESNVLLASAISLTTAIPANVTSISLTAGDWDVSAIVRIHANNASTSFTQGVASISSTSATLDATNQANITSAAVVPGNGINYCSLGVPSTRISLASTTTIYLVARATFTASTAQAYGLISARRAR